MAKPKKQKEEAKENSIGNKILSILLFITIFAFAVAVFALLIKTDVGGFGSRVLAPILKDVPGWNQILPNEKKEKKDSKTDSSDVTEDSDSRQKDHSNQTDTKQKEEVSKKDKNGKENKKWKAEKGDSDSSNTIPTEKKEYQNRVSQLADSYSKMVPETAAFSLETMTGDLELVCDILFHMKEKDSASIMAVMSSEFAARVTKKLSAMK